MLPYLLLTNFCNFLFIALPNQAVTDLKVLLPLLALPSHDFALNRFTISSYNWPIPKAQYFYFLPNLYTISPLHSAFLFPPYFKLLYVVDYGLHGVLNTHFCGAVLRQSTCIRSPVPAHVRRPHFSAGRHTKASFTLGFRNPIREFGSRMRFKKVSRFSRSAAEFPSLSPLLLPLSDSWKGPPSSQSIQHRVYFQFKNGQDRSFSSVVFV
jgi:hypothetical protein